MEKAKAVRDAAKEAGRSISEAKRIELTEKIEGNFAVIDEALLIEPAQGDELNTPSEKEAVDLAFICLADARKSLRILKDPDLQAKFNARETKLRTLKPLLVFQSKSTFEREPFTVENVIRRKREHLLKLSGALNVAEQETVPVGKDMLCEGKKCYVTNADYDIRGLEWTCFIKFYDEIGELGKLQTKRLKSLTPIDEPEGEMEL